MARWLIVIVYTLILPYAIIALRYLEGHFSATLVRKIPLMLIISLGTTYIFFYFTRNKRIVLRIIIISCCLILPFMLFQSNPNKHIHIPEYILMSWLVFHALSPDYRGKGVFLLTFLVSALLGILDEIQQGILANRFYGYGDMLMNASASLVGVLSIIGTGRNKDGDWRWFSAFRDRFLALIAIGIGTMSLGWNCFILSGVSKKARLELKNNPSIHFTDLFPSTVYLWNIVCVLALIIVLQRYMRSFIKLKTGEEPNQNGAYTTVKVTPYLWIFTLLSIMLVAHGLFVVIPYITPRFM
jgi:hypothetical protein